MSTSQSTTSPASTQAISTLWRRWPTAVGLLVAVGCYLAAAALSARWVAWAAIPVGSALVVAGALLGIDPWLVLGGTSVVLVVLGLMLGASRTALAAQSVALVAYGGVAAAALALGPTAGAILASLALIAHAIWDVIHYRRNAVVPRSLAEACMFFDVPLGATIIVLALAGLS